MKRARILLLVLWFFINACTVLAAPRLTLQPTAFAPLPSDTPLPVSSPLPSPTSSQAPTSSPTPGPTNTPAPSASLTPSLTPASSGIGLENLSSLAQLHAFLPFKINSLGNLLPNSGPGGDISSIMSSILPPVYLAMAFSPDSQTLALGGCTQLIGGSGYACIPPNKPILRLMDARSGQIIRELPGHTSSITGLAFTRMEKSYSAPAKPVMDRSVSGMYPAETCCVPWRSTQKTELRRWRSARMGPLSQLPGMRTSVCGISAPEKF